MSIIYLLNLMSVSVFGIILSAAFCDIIWTQKKYLIMTIGTVINFGLQAIVYFGVNLATVHFIYPLITHIPLYLTLCVLSRKRLWPLISVLSAYLCCQIRRWLALLIVAVSSGDSMTQSTAELLLTLPLLAFLMHFAAPSVRSLSYYPVSVQCQFGLIPALYYAFDYLTRIYTDWLEQGTLVAVEFMPFVCSVAYLIFVLRISEAERIRIRLEQTQDILNLQITQSVREIEAMRESQHQASIYRHDLRHHAQYLSTCIENGRLEQAQTYIQKIYSEIEAEKLIVFCENEAANLIFSAFAGRAREQDISLSIKAEIPQNIPVSENDLCVLLSNALENALHACQKLKEKGLPGTIEASAYEKNGKFYFQIINSCDSDIAFSHGIPIAKNPEHGIGVRSICAIVEQYGGIYSFQAKDGQFILRLFL